MDEGMKKCPSCGQEVKAAAKKCKYCGHWFTEEQSQPENDTSNEKTEQKSTENDGQKMWNSDEGNKSHEQSAPSAGKYTTDSKITVDGVLKEGISIAISNFGNIFLAAFLTFLVFFIPYINAGAFVGLKNLPLMLSQDSKAPAGTYVFDGKFRKYMGEYFNLMGLKMMTIAPTILFAFIPGYIINLGWSQALYIMFEKEINPSEALVQSTKMTYGYKITIFLIQIIMGVIGIVLYWLYSWFVDVALGRPVLFVKFIFMVLFIAIFSVFVISCNAAIYKGLKKE